MRKSKFVAYVVALLDGATSPGEREARLEGVGFKFIGNGIHKRTYAHDDEQYVVKVRKFPTERGQYDPIEREYHTLRQYYNQARLPGRNTYVPMAYVDGTIQIQRKVVPCSVENGDWPKNKCESQHIDGHCRNHTHRGGRKLLFDYD